MSSAGERNWTLLTNHGRILLLIAADPQMRIRDLADVASITERAAQMIVTDLEQAGYITKTKAGRRNVYSVRSGQPFRHPAEAGHTVGELIDLFAPEQAQASPASARKASAKAARPARSAKGTQ